MRAVLPRPSPPTVPTPREGEGATPLRAPRRAKPKAQMQYLALILLGHTYIPRGGAGRRWPRPLLCTKRGRKKVLIVEKSINVSIANLHSVRLLNSGVLHCPMSPQGLVTSALCKEGGGGPGVSATFEATYSTLPCLFSLWRRVVMAQHYY